MQPGQLTEGIFQIEMHVENRKVLNYLYLLAYIIDTHGSRTLAQEDIGLRTGPSDQRPLLSVIAVKLPHTGCPVHPSSTWLGSRLAD